MTSTNYTNFSAENVSFVNIDEKTTVVGGQKIVYKVAKFSYDHEDSDGNVATGDLVFDLPEVTIPYGLTLEKGYNLKGRFDFSRNDEAAMSCVASVSRSQTKGWVRASEVDVEVDIGTCTATPKDSDAGVEVFKTASDSAPVIATAKTEMNVVGKSPDKKFLSVVFGGSDGFFEQLRKALAKLVYDNRKEFAMGDKSYEEILSKFTDPVYIAKDKNSGALLDRDPAVYLNVIYYPARPAEGERKARQEYLARFDVPGLDEPLGLEVLKTKNVKCIPTVKVMQVTSTGGKLSMKLYVTGACVTDIEDIQRKETKSNTYNKLSQNAALVEKMRAKMAKIKLESPVRKEDLEGDDSAPVDDMPSVNANVPETKTHQSPQQQDDFDLEAMLNNGPTLGDIDLE